MKLTKYRKLILEAVEKVKTPVSAETLSLTLKNENMDLSTIYRNLEKLHSAGLIAKSVINHTAHYFISSQEHHHFMICLGCKKLFEIDCHIHDFVEQMEAKTKFEIVHHDLTFYGYCPDCQKLPR